MLLFVQVQGHGLVVFTYLGQNVEAAELGGFEDVIFDACCKNIASDDEIWHHVVEASVLLVSLAQKSNPRSPWYVDPCSSMFFQMLWLLRIFFISSPVKKANKVWLVMGQKKRAQLLLNYFINCFYD